MNNLKKLITLFSVFIFFQFSHAEENREIIKDSISTLKVKPFANNIADKYKDGEFDYTTNDTDGINLLQLLLEKFFNWLKDMFGIDLSFLNSQILEYIIYGIFGCLIIYLIVRTLTDTPMNSIFKKEDRKIAQMQFTEESIESVDFDGLISKAVSEKDYRLAVRYLYLKSLQLLSGSNIIEWHFDKTNADYQAEIKNPDTKRFFKNVSYVYDYVWYGEFAIDKTAFERTQDNFNQLNQSIR